MAGPVLVGDVGGTHCRFALATRRDGAIRLSGVQKLRNDDHACFADALGAYQAGLEEMPRRALFALAGPPARDGSIKLVNRDWPRVHPGELARTSGLEQVRLVNDFAAMARAVPELPEAAFEWVREGRSESGAPVIVTGPGTGFGVGTLIPLATGGYHVLTGEGGHAAFSPYTVREAELAERLSGEYGYVSTEMIVSGAWLQPVLDHLSDMHGRPREALAAGDILARAEAGDALCEEVCQLRARAIMGAAGDLVLINGGRGGVVLTGGVAERMTGWLRACEALARFEARGSHSDYMSRVPVRVLHEPTAPLIGAAALIPGDAHDH
ncbi:MAG: glucokinase [Alphaproteobacteria bacterium]|jgi:glucokinase|nr:glucokinase [Alphaproteobacteria bacterium]